MRKKVLLSPLYWGFGHVARMIPLRDQLKKSEYEIFWLIDTALKNFILTHCQDDHMILNKEQEITELKTMLEQKQNILYKLYSRSHNLNAVTYE